MILYNDSSLHTERRTTATFYDVIKYIRIGRY